MSEPAAERELAGIRERYRRRERKRGRGWREPEVCLRLQDKERVLLAWLREEGPGSVDGMRLLEIGCGSGGELLQWLRLGFDPRNLAGNELLERRLAEARRRLPAEVTLYGGDARDLPFAPGEFDVVYQSTVFTSILTPAFQEDLARRMWDWVRPGGGVLWYDFVYDNPRNPDVRGVPPARLRKLFPRGRLSCRRVTLAPPLGRPAARVHPALYGLLNVVPLLRSHLLCWIRKED